MFYISTFQKDHFFRGSYVTEDSGNDETARLVAAMLDAGYSLVGIQGQTGGPYNESFLEQANEYRKNRHK